MPKRVTPEQKNEFWKWYERTGNRAEAARRAHVSYGWAKTEVKGGPRNGRDYHDRKELTGPIPLDELEAEPRRALNDICFFAERYFGAIVMPWQEIATALIVELQATDDEEYAVINCPPGSGKSTFFTLILPAWLTCRRRHIRGMIGSASMTMAKQYLGELRDVLAAPEPFHQDPEAIKALYAVPPVAALAADFGGFRLEDGKWAADAFQVAQHGGHRFRAKEFSWQAFGRGTRFLGTRVRFAVWDDVWDDDEMRSADARTELKEKFWVKKAETRIEPGGLLVLQGQRMDPEDIYRFALDRKKMVYDPETGEVVKQSPKYHHIVFPAHSEEACKGPAFHKRSSPAWDGTEEGGCLLFPRRITWEKLEGVRENSPEDYEIVYQQRDVARGGYLVESVWVNGGVDDDGIEYLGCWDHDRGIAQLPEGLTRPLLSVVTADPSPTQYWAVCWWVFHPDTGQRFLMDLERRRMGANDFLDYIVATRSYTGLMPAWQARSKALGVPITHWIVEKNAAQRFMLQYDLVRTWLRLNSVQLIDHETYGNKADPQMGVTSTRSHWKHGRVRLPGRHEARVRAMKLVHEAERYRLDGKTTTTTDCVMAHWFLEWNLGRLTPKRGKTPPARVPSWLRKSA